MRINRRNFIQGLGVAVASLLLSRCGLRPTGTSTSARGRLRDCWLRLDWLAQETRDHFDSKQEDGPLNQLTAEHDAALNELVQAGEVGEAVAAELRAAFGAAAYHVWRSNAPMTCYEPMMIDFAPTSAGQLVQQAAALEEMAAKGQLDPATVAQAQAVVEHDMAFVSLSADEQQALYAQVLQQAGNQYTNLPPFEEVELEVTPEMVEAARYLVNLLAGTAGG